MRAPRFMKYARPPGRASKQKGDKMNLCIFSGRLTADAKQAFAASGTSVASFSIAVDCGYGEHKRTEFIKCILFRREGLIQHLTKGKPVTITGEYQERKWTDKEGQERRTSEFIVRELEFQQGSPKGQVQPSTPDIPGDEPF